MAAPLTTEQQQEQAEAEAAQDRAEAAAAAVVAAMLLVDIPVLFRLPGIGRIPGLGWLKRWFTVTSRESLLAKLSPILIPLVIGELARAAKRSSEVAPGVVSVDTSSYGDIARRVVERAVDDFLKVAPDIADRISDTARENKQDEAQTAADAAARILVTSTVNGAKQQTADVFGFTKKTWRTRLDDRVRTSHALLEGKTVPIAATFAVGQTGAPMLHPGDKTGPVGEWINCRCGLEIS